MPRVSVVMPAHNEERLIGEALGSLLAQTYADFEIVVIDDGSTDRTPEKIEALGDSRIRVIRQARAGQPGAMNRGIREARGEFIARHDADDLSTPDRFSKQVAFLDAHPDVAVVGTWSLERDGAGHDRLIRVPTSPEEIRLAMAWGNPFVHTAVTMRRAAVEAAGLYANVFLEDYDLWIRMAALFPLANLPEPLVVRRLRPGSRGSGGGRSHSLRERLRLQRLAIRQLGLPATAWLGVLRTLAGVALYATIERTVGPSSSTRGAT